MARSLLRTALSVMAAVSMAGVFSFGVPALPSTHADASVPVPTSAVFKSGAFQAGSKAPPGGVYGHARAFVPSSMQAAYDLNPLYKKGIMGQGKTIAIVDSFGYPQVASDLETFSQAYGLPLMCGMPKVTCKPGMPTFKVLHFGNHTYQVRQPSRQANPNGPAQEATATWAGEVALDTQWAHAIAPEANILLVVTPTAETLGVQGLPNMMKAEAYVVKHHLADVVTQSFGAAEGSFASKAALENLRGAFKTGTSQGMTFVAASGDYGSVGLSKTPVGQGGQVLNTPQVGWPASDPLVTAVGGTTLCANPQTGVGVDSADPPAACTSHPGMLAVAWNGSGGGFSSVFAKPAYQDTLPPGSTKIGSMRGVPDVSWDASCRSFVWVYMSAKGAPAGYWGICGTSAASPQFAAMVALADQYAGKDLGIVNVSLYSLASSPQGGTYFYDVVAGDNQQAGTTVLGYAASTGWDPVTGLGMPDAANLVPALAAAGAHTKP